jgi:hypothetical protein
VRTSNATIIKMFGNEKAEGTIVSRKWLIVKEEVAIREY